MKFRAFLIALLLAMTLAGPAGAAPPAQPRESTVRPSWAWPAFPSPRRPTAWWPSWAWWWTAR